MEVVLVKNKVAPAHIMKAQDHCLGTTDRGQWSASHPSCLTPRKEPWYPQNGRLGGSHNQSGHLVKHKISFCQELVLGQIKGVIYFLIIELYYLGFVASLDAGCGLCLTHIGRLLFSYRVVYKLELSHWLVPSYISMPRD